MVTPLISETSKRLLDAMMTHVPAGIVVASAPDLTIVKVSDVGSRDLGRCRTELEGRPVPSEAARHRIFRHGADTEATISDLPIVRATRDGEVITNEEWIVEDPDGRLTTLCINAGPVRDDYGDIVGGIAAWTDITKQKETELALRMALENEGMLLREANHRIKNHLQMIAGLVQAEAANLGEEASRLAQSVLSRLSVLAVAHEGFYMAKAVGIVDAEPLLKGIAKALECSLHPIAVTAQPGTTLMDAQVTPVSLAVNEAVSNALKHAYPTGGSGPIHISIRRADGKIEVQVADEGAGLPEHPREGSLGLKIMAVLARQLGGSYSLTQRPMGGALFTLTFPEPPPCP